jgi:hypothetical protein
MWHKSHKVMTHCCKNDTPPMSAVINLIRFNFGMSFASTLYVALSAY